MALFGSYFWPFYKSDEKINALFFCFNLKSFEIFLVIHVGEKFAKDVIMWSPDQALNLYLDGDKSKVVDLSNQALLDEKFPKFKNASKHIGRLQSGKDLLRNGHTLHLIYFFEIYHLGGIANVKI